MPVLSSRSWRPPRLGSILCLGAFALAQAGCAGSHSESGDETPTANLSSSKKPSLAQFKLMGPPGTVLRLPTLAESKMMINGTMTPLNRPLRFDGQTVVRFPGRCRDGYQPDTKLPSDAWPVEMTLADPEEQGQLLYAKGLLCFFTRKQTDLDPEFFELSIPPEKVLSVKKGRDTEVIGKDKTGTPLYKFILHPGP